ncbi:MAG: hypothetical protein ACD_56C00134G0003 [uncultured bacterium]|nr:MAG: hypothetical protein ACD_56C00134G0003 [uncultured bacterium]
MKTLRYWFLLSLVFLLFSGIAHAADCGSIIYISNGGSSNPAVNPDPPLNTTPDSLPDFITKKLWLVNSSGQEIYTYDWNQSIAMHSDSKNVGQADWAKFAGETEADDIYVKFYLSNGYKEDSHSEWKCVGTEQIQKGNLDVGETKHETATLNLATANNGTHLNAGVYNIVACVDRKYDQDNGDGEVPEMHKSNNCSTEAVFTVTEPNYQPTGYLEGINCNAAWGWTKDPNTENPIDIHIYRKNLGSSTEIFQASISANTYRSDVGSHGFSWTIPTSLKTGSAYTLIFYALDSSGGSNPIIGQSQISCATPVYNLYPTYRAFNHDMQSHFYTIWESEKNTLGSLGWLLEGVAFYAHDRQEPNTAPVYRFYRTGRGHFFTISEAEKNSLIGSPEWIFEGVAFYAYPWQVSGTVPVYRLYRHSDMNHFFTASEAEKNYVISYDGHIYEGIGWFAYTTPPN